MPFRHDDQVAPPVAREGHQVGELRQAFRGDADIGLARQNPFGDVFGRTLLQGDSHVRERAAEALHGARQRVACLRVRRRHRQGARALALVLQAGLLQVLRFDQQAVDDLQDALARLRQARQPLAVTLEDDDTEFVLQLADLAAHARLRREQRIGHFGQVVVAARRLADGAQLLEIHMDAPPSTNTCRRLGRTTRVSPTLRARWRKRSFEMVSSISWAVSELSMSSWASGPMAWARRSLTTMPSAPCS